MRKSTRNFIGLLLVLFSTLLFSSCKTKKSCGCPTGFAKECAPPVLKN